MCVCACVCVSVMHVCGGIMLCVYLCVYMHVYVFVCVWCVGIVKMDSTLRLGHMMEQCLCGRWPLVK